MSCCHEIVHPASRCIDRDTDCTLLNAFMHAIFGEIRKRLLQYRASDMKSIAHSALALIATDHRAGWKRSRMQAASCFVEAD